MPTKTIPPELPAVPRGLVRTGGTSRRNGGARNGAQHGLRRLVGSGDKIGLVTLPFLVVGGLLNWASRERFSVGGPSATLRLISILVLVRAIVIWIWSVVLILVKVPRGELITTGPFSVVRHPLYTDVALFVLPWAGFLL